ncbi:hypothetical protein ES703_93943 [subsurface metagenome]
MNDECRNPVPGPQPPIPCPGCGATESVKRIRTDGVHYASLHCGRCGRWLAWLPKPCVGKKWRPGRHRELVRKYSRGYCELCLRKAEELPGGQTLEGHHVRELQHGGSDARDNVTILCSACHRLVHWVRTWVVGRDPLYSHPPAPNLQPLTPSP